MPWLLLFLFLCVSALAAAPAQAYQDKCGIKTAVGNDSVVTGKHELFYAMDIDDIHLGTCRNCTGLSHGDAIEMDKPIPGTTSTASQSSDLINCRANNWTTEEYRRNCLARIVDHVYSMKKEAIPLSSRTGFRLHGEPLKNFGEIYAAIFEYVGEGSEDKSAPHLIVAFRGTDLDLCSKWRVVGDMWFNLLIGVDVVKYSSRFRLAFQKLKNLTLDNPDRPVWLTGHSAGASMALHVGIRMVLKKGVKLRTFAFNPPVAMLGWLPGGVKKVIGTLLPSKRKQSLKLSKWTPELYVNQRDILCCRRIIGCLEKPTKLDKRIINLPSVRMCENSDVVQGGEQCGGPHSLEQWFSPNNSELDLDVTCQSIQEYRKHIRDREALSRFSFSLGYASDGLHAEYQGDEFPLSSSVYHKHPKSIKYL